MPNSASRIARHISRFTQKEIDYLFQNSEFVVRQAGLSLKIGPALLKTARILIVTPKKIGNAPQRNKIKRQLKAIFYEEKLYLKSFDYLVLCKKEVISLTFDQLKEILLKAAQSC